MARPFQNNFSGAGFVFAQEGGFEADAVKVIVGRGCLSEVTHGGKEVDADGELVGDAVGGNCSGPPCNGGDAVAAFPYGAFVPAQRSVGFGILPGAAVVGEKEDEGVFLNAEFPHCAHDFGQAVVHGFHHLAIGFLEGRRDGSLLFPDREWRGRRGPAMGCVRLRGLRTGKRACLCGL